MSIISTGELRSFYQANLYIANIMYKKNMLDIRNIGCPLKITIKKYSFKISFDPNFKWFVHGINMSSWPVPHSPMILAHSGLATDRKIV